MIPLTRACTIDKFTETVRWWPGAGGREEGEVLFNGDRVSV